MSESIHTPDAPFRHGTTGKYKLLVKNVTPGYSSFEYLLEDCEGKQYSSTSETNYPVGGVLRCIISFKIEKAKLEVVETIICKRQDFVTPIPGELKKLNRGSLPSSETTPDKNCQQHPTTKALPKPPIAGPKSKEELGRPKERLISGYYILRVIDYSIMDAGYSIWLADADGNRYRTFLKHHIRIGTIVSCRLRIRKLSNLIDVDVLTVKTPKDYRVKSSRKRKKTHAKHHGGGYSPREWLPSPCVGDRFRLIYTPMGNKR